LNLFEVTATLSWLPEPTDRIDLVQPVFSARHLDHPLGHAQDRQYDPSKQSPERSGDQERPSRFNDRYDCTSDGFLADFSVGWLNLEWNLGAELLNGDLETGREAILVEPIVGPSPGEGYPTNVLNRRQARLRVDALSGKRGRSIRVHL
jgi:hypothetical protein